MTAFRLRPAFVVWLLAMLVIVVSGMVLLPFPRRPTGWEEIAWTIGFGVGFLSVGAVLVDRRPREPISRIALGVGLLVVAAVGLRAASVWLDARPGDLPPVAAVAGVLAQALQTLAFLAAGGFLLVRFPDGREPGRLSTISDVLVGFIALNVLIEAVAPGPLEIAWLPEVDNPIGIQAVEPLRAAGLGAGVLALYALSVAVSLVVIVKRYRRAETVTRAQIRWVGSAAAVPIVMIPLVAVTDWLWSAWLLSTLLLPLAIGIAILRYRLYDIDRIVGRTLAYAILSALMAAVFVGTNVVLQYAVAGATGRSSLAVAASTLLVAALFQPIRRQVQAPIDRRFNRAHLDAERLVGGFARRARDEVDLGRLREAVVTVAVEGVGPSGAGLWLRPAHRGAMPPAAASTDAA